MALKGETRIGVRHSLSVVDHLDGCLSRIHHKHVDAAGSGVNGVLHQFLDDRRGALYHLTGCYLVGHGIGTALHEDPQIPNYAQKRRGVRLQAGMTLAIEPMINAGTWQVRFLRDGWTVVTKDGSLSAHYENTILVTDGEPEILTLY